MRNEVLWDGAREPDYRRILSQGPLVKRLLGQLEDSIPPSYSRVSATGSKAFSLAVWQPHDTQTSHAQQSLGAVSQLPFLQCYMYQGFLNLVFAFPWLLDANRL